MGPKPFPQQATCRQGNRARPAMVATTFPGPRLAFAKHECKPESKYLPVASIWKRFLKLVFTQSFLT